MAERSFPSLCNGQNSAILVLEAPFLAEMTKFLFEACVDSLHSALEAQRGGAGRLELCASLTLGGTTPSYGLVKLVKEQVHLPVHVLIRPRAGDFIYSSTELAVMLEDIEMVGKLGVEGVVIGVLTNHKEIDVPLMRRLLDKCQEFGLSVTFHRAFDLVREPVQSLMLLMKLDGVSRVLTSGQQENAQDGIELIRLLMTKTTGRIGIMPGGGVSELNARYIVEQTGVHELHGSLRTPLTTSKHVMPGDVNNVIWTTDAKRIRRVVTIGEQAVVEHHCLCQSSQT